MPALADARARLLAPGAPVVPARGALWAQLVELRPATRLAEALAAATGDRWDLDALNVFNHDGAVANPNATGTRLQKRPHARALAAPVKLFDFDFAEAPADLARRRELSIRVDAAGVLNAAVLWFDLDVGAGHAVSSGPAAPAASAWDQLVRFLPCEIAARPGDRLDFFAEHSADEVCLYLRAKTLPDHAVDPATAVGHVDLPGDRGHAVCVTAR